ncbi:hypothetical protein [Streptomyces sp. NPDC047928]|uniref:hypothetical protein n=1 Tax=unclassified Streptomyces TaxID=2593676 RepID=UPI003721E8DD
MREAEGGTDRRAERAWFSRPLLVFLLGSLLLSVLSHAFDGGVRLALTAVGGALELTGATWGVVSWVAVRRARRQGATADESGASPPV